MRKNYIEFHELAGSSTKFTGAEVVVTESFVFFWKPPAVFGQWTMSDFESDGIHYNCAEQYMMAEKARLFEDHGALSKILASESPRTQKALGQKVRGFTEKAWRKNREQIVTKGNLAKFSQNSEMREELLETGDKTLVEASPLDRIWGIGLRADDPRVLDPHLWQGLNLLGKALMSVRDALRAEGG